SHAQPELGRRGVARGGGLRHALHLQATQRLRGAGGTGAKMRFQAREFFLRASGIHVSIQLVAPQVTRHRKAPCSLAANNSRMAFRARERRDITVPMGMPSVSPISW